MNKQKKESKTAAADYIVKLRKSENLAFFFGFGRKKDSSLQRRERMVR